MRVVPFLVTLAACGGSDPLAGLDTARPASYASFVSAERYTADLEALTGARTPGKAGWQAAQDRCAAVFAEAGFEVARHDYGSGINVIGRKAGAGPQAQTVVVSAHYDSVARCDGADDNASGVAGVLEAARLLGRGSFQHDLVVACWDEEERGLAGSRAWVAQQSEAGTDIRFAWSLEMIGYASSKPDSQALPDGFELIFPDVVATVSANDWRGDFIAYIADDAVPEALAAFRTHAGSLPVVDIQLSEGQRASPLLDDLQRSDHASFWAAGHPGVMVTDTANFRNAAYHCLDGDDTVARLDMDFAVNTTRAVVGATAVLLEPRGSE